LFLDNPLTLSHLLYFLEKYSNWSRVLFSSECKFALIEHFWHTHRANKFFVSSRELSSYCVRVKNKFEHWLADMAFASMQVKKNSLGEKKTTSGRCSGAIP
jgi:hypothetical protein